MAVRKQNFSAVGGYNVNASSIELSSQYFTSTEECAALFSICEQVWGDLAGKRALEPSAGSGNFVRVSNGLNTGLQWVTNEMDPDLPFETDFQSDFLTLTQKDTGEIDLVLGNPPFSGSTQYRDVRTSLGMAFILHALTFSDRVAFVVPPNVLRVPWLAKLPKDVEVVAWTEMRSAEYVLGGGGAGQNKDVQTCCVLFERTGCEDNGYEVLSGELPDVEFVEDEAEATHAIQLWGGLNARALDGTWGRRFPWASECLVKVKTLEAEAFLASKAMTAYVSQFTAASPQVGVSEVRHLLHTRDQ